MYVLSKREVFLSASLLGDRQLGKHTSEDRTLRNIGPSVSHGPPSLLCGSSTLPVFGVCYLCKKDNSFAIRPNDMVHLRAHPLPRQLWSAEAGLQGRTVSPCGSSEMQTKAQLYRGETSPHRFPCWSGPYCIRCNYFSFGPNAPVSLHSYFLK